MKAVTFLDKLGVVIFAVIAMDLKWSICATLNDVMYSFQYAIDQSHLGLLTHHFEDRKGDIVRGSYSVLEPTGRIRIVEYQVAGPSGFRAVVKYRKPPGQPLVGHLQFPHYYRHPIRLAEPVGLITTDLLQGHTSHRTLHL